MPGTALDAEDKNTDSGCGKTGTSTYHWWEFKNGVTTLEQSLAVPQNAKHRVTI